MNRSRRHRRIVRLLCTALVSASIASAGCSSDPAKPDTQQEDITQASATSGSETKSADQKVAASPQEEQTGRNGSEDAIASPEEGQEQVGPGESIKISSEFKSELASALDEAQADNRAGAVTKLQNLVGRTDGGFLAAYNLGVLYENEGDYPKAAKRYSQALTKNPQFSPALLNLVRLYIRLDQPRDADELARKYSDLCPENMDHRAVGLQIELHAGKYEEAIRKAKRILRRDEKNVEAMLAMAEANIQLDRGELAEAILDRALELRPERAEIYFKFAKIRAERGRISEAIAVLERALEYRANYPEARNNLGVLYHEAGDYTAAVREFRAALGDYPDYKEAYLNLGNSLKGLRKYKKAEEAFQKALEIDATYADALFNLGVLYLDSDIEGVEKIAQLNTSIDYFNKYKSVLAGRVSKDDPSEKYVAEARKAIETEKQRQEMMRQAQMQAEEEPVAEDEEETSEDFEEATAEGE